jgi:hypothetical protein
MLAKKRNQQEGIEEDSLVVDNNIHMSSSKIHALASKLNVEVSDAGEGIGRIIHL